MSDSGSPLRALEGMDDEDEDEDEHGGALDVLGIVTMLGEHYHEGYAQVTRWPWRVFCARWAQVYSKARKERLRREAEDEDRRTEAELGDLRSR